MWAGATPLRAPIPVTIPDVCINVSVAVTTGAGSPTSYASAINRSIGAAIQAARKAKGLTQSELAAAVGVSRGSIANFERGEQTLSVPLLVELAHALDASPADLLVEPPRELWLQGRAPQELRQKAHNLVRSSNSSIDEEDRSGQEDWIFGLLEDSSNAS